MEISPQLKGDNENQQLQNEAYQHQRILAQASRMNTDLANETNGQLNPSYAYVARAAGCLSLGEVIIEPHLGQVRLAGTQEFRAHVQLTWSDDHGHCHATAWYAAEQIFPVRVPSSADYQYIQQKVDAASWRSDIPPRAARLIAAHLHTGPASQLYRFALDGLLDDRLFDELDGLATQQPHYGPWVHALTRFCMGIYRDDPGPIGPWHGRVEDEAVPASKNSPKRTGVARQRNRGPLPRGRLDADFVQQLLDAAFDLGKTAARRGKVILGTSSLPVVPTQLVASAEKRSNVGSWKGAA